MTSDDTATLPEDQAHRLQILKDIATFTATTRVGGKDIITPAAILTLADWVVSGEPTFHHLPSGFAEAVAQMQTPVTNTEQIIIHEIAEDGLPDMTMLNGQVAFLYEGAIISGHPGRVSSLGNQYWMAADTVSHGQEFDGVEYWVEFPLSIWELTR